SNLARRAAFLETLRLIPAGDDLTLALISSESQRLMSTLAGELPNEARMEIIRISRNREAQYEVAKLLIKSATSVSAAIGAQPIPLADLRSEERRVGIECRMYGSSKKLRQGD